MSIAIRQVHIEVRTQVLHSPLSKVEQAGFVLSPCAGTVRQAKLNGTALVSALARLCQWFRRGCARGVTGGGAVAEHAPTAAVDSRAVVGGGCRRRRPLELLTIPSTCSNSCAESHRMVIAVTDRI